jgi:hypothetical protein
VWLNFQDLSYIDGEATVVLDVAVTNSLAPVIASQPQSETNQAGATATFLVLAEGSPPLGYQWQFNSTNLSDSSHITGSSSNVLTIGNVGATDGGSYDVVITNLYGAVTSSMATLSVSGSAPLTGDLIQLDWRYPDVNTHAASSAGYPYPFTVGTSGTAFTNGYNPELAIQVTSNSITIAAPPIDGEDGQTFGFSGPPGSPDGASDVGANGETVTFNGAVFTDYSHDFSDVTIAWVTAYPDLDSSRITVAGNRLYVNFMGLYNTVGLSQVRLNVLAGTTNSANLIVNGSFEMPVIGSDSFGWGVVPAGWVDPGSPLVNSSGPGWSYPGGLVPPAEDGQQYGDMGDDSRYLNSSLSQTFTVVTSGTFTLSWYDNTGYEGEPTSANYDVTITDATGAVVSSNYLEPVPVEQSLAAHGWDRRGPDLKSHEMARRH